MNTYIATFIGEDRSTFEEKYYADSFSEAVRQAERHEFATDDILISISLEEE